MKTHNCEKCQFRAIHDKKPTSILGRLWRWHIGWCPGWKKYFNTLPIEEQARLKQLYNLPQGN